MIYHVTVQTKERAATVMETLIELGGCVTAVTQSGISYTVFVYIPDTVVLSGPTRWEALNTRVRSAVLVTHGAYPEL